VIGQTAASIKGNAESVSHCVSLLLAALFWGGDDPGAGKTAARAVRSGDVAWHLTLLGIVESSLCLVHPRDSQQCHTRSHAGPRPSSHPFCAVCAPVFFGAETDLDASPNACHHPPAYVRLCFTDYRGCDRHFPRKEVAKIVQAVPFLMMRASAPKVQFTTVIREPVEDLIHLIFGGAALPLMPSLFHLSQHFSAFV